MKMREFYTDFNLIPPGFTGILKWKNGDVRWMINGNLHRTDGPALITGKGRKEWYYNGRRIHTNDCFYIEPNFLSSKVKVEANEEVIEIDEVEGQGPFTWCERPIPFKRILSQHGFLYLPNLPGI
jgi:hypothetical protein